MGNTAKKIEAVAEAPRLRLRILRDESAENPRDWDHDSVIVCWHRRGKYGDEQPREEPAEWREAFDTEHTDAIILPVYMYEHGGVVISTGSFADSWDSGQLGWIYVTREKARAWFMVPTDAPWTKELQHRVEAALSSEVETYNQWVNGDVFGYVLDTENVCGECGHVTHEETDSCWGFFDKAGIADSLPNEAKELLDDAWDKRYD